MKRLPAIILFVLIVSLSCSRMGMLYKPDAKPEISTLTQDGAWCWFQDPRAVYVEGKHKRTYAQWMTESGRLMIGFVDHDSGEIQTDTLKTDWEQDDHNVGSFIVLPDKRLMVFYALHDKHGLYCRTASEPEQISRWEEEITISDTDHITYSHPVYLEAEKQFYVFWRGPSWKPTFSTSRDGKLWTEPKVLLQEIGRESRTIRPYTKIFSDGKSSIHFTFTDGHPRMEPQNSVYYMKYEGGSFYKADGSLIGTLASLPVQHSRTDLVYDGKKTSVRAWIWDIATDKKGRPLIAYTRLPQETDHRYCIARWMGKTWRDEEMTPAGAWFPQTPEGQTEPEPHYSGGMAFKHSRPDIVYVSKGAEDKFFIEKFQWKGKRRGWTGSALITGPDKLNVRPLVPRGYSKKPDHLLWMTGRYIHYTDYNTAIRMLLP